MSTSRSRLSTSAVVLCLSTHLVADLVFLDCMLISVRDYIGFGLGLAAIAFWLVAQVRLTDIIRSTATDTACIQNMLVP